VCMLRAGDTIFLSGVVKGGEFYSRSVTSFSTRIPLLGVGSLGW
jgi:hypothetical protein